MIDPLSPVYLIFTLPGPEGGRRIRCDGYVAHASCEEGRCILGIHFADLSEADQAAIDAYIDSVV